MHTLTLLEATLKTVTQAFHSFCISTSHFQQTRTTTLTSLYTLINHHIVKLDMR